MQPCSIPARLMPELECVVLHIAGGYIIGVRECDDIDEYDDDTEIYERVGHEA